MLKSKINKAVAALAVLAGALATAMPAQAASYSLTLDPPFGLAFPQLSWSAAGVVDVGSDCTSLGNASYFGSGDPVSGSCTAADIMFTSMAVTFYETATPANSTTFNVLGGPISVNRITIAGNALTEIDAGFFTTFTPLLGDSIFGIAGTGLTSFALRTYGSGVGDNGLVNTGVLTWFKNPPITSPQGCIGTSYTSSPPLCGESNGAPVRINAIPEPQTYALIFAGLVVAFMARRGRRMS